MAADLTAADVTVTILDMRKVADRNLYNVSLAFGDSSLEYPAGGVPLDIGKLGCPNVVESLTIYDDGISLYQWSYDKTNKKLTAIELDGSPAQPSDVGIAAQVLKCEVMGW